MSDFNIRDFDLNEVAEVLDNRGLDISTNKVWKPINQLLINDADKGDTVEVYAQLSGAVNFEDVDYVQAEAVVEGTIESINRALKAAKTGLEIVRVDMVESTSYMLVNAKETPKQFIKRVF